MQRTNADDDHHGTIQSQTPSQMQTTSTALRCQRRTLLLLYVSLCTIVVCLSQMPNVSEAASLSISVSDSQLRMLGLLNILSKTENTDNNNNIHQHKNHHHNIIIAESSANNNSNENYDDDDDDDDDDDFNRIELSNKELYEYEHAPIHHARHRKRQSEYSYEEEQPNQLEWSNPCKGIYQPSESVDISASRQTHRKLVNATVYKQYTVLNYNKGSIAVNDIDQWKMFNNSYKFLPVHAERNSLRRWYRRVQIYVATFAYLERAQTRWEQSKQLKKSGTAEELETLLKNARELLCELETAINGSFPHNSNEKLTSFTRAQMNKKLNSLLTKTTEIEMEETIEPFIQDLKFAKYNYMQYLVSIFDMVKAKKNRKAGESSSGSSSMDENDSLSSHESMERIKQRATTSLHDGQSGSKSNAIHRRPLKSNNRSQPKSNQRQARKD